MNSQHSSLRAQIETAWAVRAELGPDRHESGLRRSVDECLDGLESGALRVAEPSEDGWVVNEWLKQAILLHFKITPNRAIAGGLTHSFDKVDLRFSEPADAPGQSG